MKNKKKGFSLAEVLIAVTIASIIATMGFTIAKRGIAKSYDRYIYNGYYSLASVLSHAEEGLGQSMIQCFNANKSLSDVNSCEFSKTVVEALSGRHVGIKHNGNHILDFDAPNGINYYIKPLAEANLVFPNAENEFPTNSYVIRMTVPAAKTRQTNASSICMVYVENLSYSDGNKIANVLYPMASGTGANVCSAMNNNQFDIHAGNSPLNIQNRIDLLTFYIEDGNRGRVVNGTYQPRVFRNAREAMCLLYGKNENGIITLPTELREFGNCTNLDSTLRPEKKSWENSEGILRITDPRRV